MAAVRIICASRAIRARPSGPGQRAGLDLLELGLVDRALVEQSLGLHDLGRGAAVPEARRVDGGLPDAGLERAVGHLRALEVALGEAVVLGDQVDERPE